MSVHRGKDLRFHDLPGRRSADPLEGLDSQVSVRVVIIEPGVDRSPHRHPKSSEVVYVVEGHGVVWHGGATTEVGPGDVVHIPTGTAHATIARAGPMRLVCFFPDADLATNIEELDEVITLKPSSG